MVSSASTWGMPGHCRLMMRWVHADSLREPRDLFGHVIGRSQDEAIIEQMVESDAEIIIPLGHGLILAPLAVGFVFFLEIRPAPKVSFSAGYHVDGRELFGEIEHFETSEGHVYIGHYRDSIG